MGEYNNCVFCDREIADDKYAATYMKKIICSKCVDRLIGLSVIKGQALMRFINERRGGIKRIKPKFYNIPG